MPKMFPGGVHPKDGKALSAGSEIKTAPLMDKYIVPLAMHIGAPAKLIVREGDKVLKGQVLAEANGFVSAPIHSPTSGTIVSISKTSTTGEMLSVNNCIGPTGKLVPAITIESDGEDKACEPMPSIDWKNADAKTIIDRIREAGVVGMGGAAFPTSVKLSPPPEKNIDTLILNGAECEPCLTADHRLMLEDSERIVQGALITAKALGVDKIIIGIENNKPDAVKVMTEVAGDRAVVKSFPVMYPQGAEKQLIYACTKRRVPKGTLPMEAGCVVQNVGTMIAIHEAVVDGIPLFERITTVTGTPVVEPGNWKLRIGTTLDKVLTLAKGVKKDVPVGKIILGGPMMGMAQYSLTVPIMKNASGVLLLAQNEVKQYESLPCIRCGRCVDVCPMGLMPATMSVQIEKEQFELAENTNVMDCIECGCCSYACPSRRPLVQLYRHAKAEINAQRRKNSQK